MKCFAFLFLCLLSPPFALVNSLVHTLPDNSVHIPRLEVNAINGRDYDDVVSKVDDLDRFFRNLDFLQLNNHLSWSFSRGLRNSTSFVGTLRFSPEEFVHARTDDDGRVTLASFDHVLLTEKTPYSACVFANILKPGSFHNIFDANITVAFSGNLRSANTVGGKSDCDPFFGISDTNISVLARLTDSYNHYVRIWLWEDVHPYTEQQDKNLPGSTVFVCKDDAGCGIGDDTAYDLHWTASFSRHGITFSDLYSNTIGFPNQPFDARYDASVNSRYRIAPENGLNFICGLDNEGERIVLYNAVFTVTVDFEQ